LPISRKPMRRLHASLFLLTNNVFETISQKEPSHANKGNSSLSSARCQHLP
jgi:hypothetical protein